MTRKGLSLLLLLLVPGLGMAAEEVRVEKDVSYLGVDRSEKLDLYFPPGHLPTGRAPAIVIIHGGGWTGGDKARGRELNIGTTLARAGYVCASINYLLGDAPKSATFAAKLASGWPGNLRDCRTAVRFLRSRAADYGIHPDRIGVIGGSAGGHLTAMVGYCDEEIVQDPDRLYPKFSSRVQAVVPLYGPQDLVFRARKRKLGSDPQLLKFCRLVSPVTHLTVDDPPTLILHGTRDTTVDIEQSEALATACRRTGIEFQYRVVKDAPHSFHLQPKGHDLRPLVTRFFDRHLKGKPRVVARELRRERLQIENRPGFIIWPTKPRPGPTPWVFYAPTLGEGLPGTAEAWMFRQFLDAGIAVAGIDVGESYGSPEGRRLYDRFHGHLTGQYGFSGKACLLARSRGGLMLYSWAAAHPEKVQCATGIYPVCNIASYPGVARAAGAYGKTAAELTAVLEKHNPVDRLQPLAQAGVPIYHIHGDVDRVVPLEKNTQLLATRYRQLGGKVSVFVAKGQGHNMWAGFFQHQPLVDFILGQAQPLPGGSRK